MIQRARANWRQFALLAGTLADRLGVACATEVVAVLTVASEIVVIARLPETHRAGRSPDSTLKW